MGRVTTAPPPSPLARLLPVVLGLVAMAASIALGVYLGRVLWWHYALGAAGLASVFGGVLWTQDTSWRDTLASLAYAFFGTVCAFALYLISANRPWRVDITREGLFTLSPQTISLLRDLPDAMRIEVVSLLPFGEHEEQMRLFRMYAEQAPQVSFRVLDPDLDIVEVRKLEEMPLPGDLIVTARRGDEVVRRRKFKLASTGSLREQTLSNALAEIALGRDRKLYFSVDHGERPLHAPKDWPQARRGLVLGRWTDLLDERAYPCEPVQVSQGIPADAAALVIAGPDRDFTAIERDIVLEFLRNGGSLFVMFDPLPGDDTPTPNLDEIVAFTGLAAPNRVILDPSSTAATRSIFTPMVRAEGKHPVVSSTNREPFHLNLARPLMPAAKPDPTVQLDVILATGESCWSESNAELRDNPRHVPPRDPAQIGALAVGVAATVPTGTPIRPASSRVVIVTDSDAFTDAMLTNESAVLGLMAVNWLAGRESLLSVPPRLIEATPVRLTQAGLFAMGGTFLLIGIGIGAGGAAFALARRRRR